MRARPPSRRLQAPSSFWRPRRVRRRSRRGSTSACWETAWRSRAIALEPGQQVAYSPEVLEEPAEIDPAVVVAWQQGLLIFKDEPLAAVIEEVNRYRLGKIILTKRELESLRVNGVFHLDRLDGVIAQVRSLGAEVTTLPGGFVLLS